MPTLVNIIQSYAPIAQVVHIINVSAIFINFRKEIFVSILIATRVGNKKPAKKNQKNHLKKSPQSGVFWVLLVFFKTDICFWCKSHYFSCKMSLEESYLGCN
jgi:hypothetical protein